MKKTARLLLCAFAVHSVPDDRPRGHSPKPSVVVDFNGLDTQTYYATLLSRQKTTARTRRSVGLERISTTTRTARTTIYFSGSRSMRTRTGITSSSSFPTARRRAGSAGPTTRPGNLKYCCTSPKPTDLS